MKERQTRGEEMGEEEEEERMDMRKAKDEVSWKEKTDIVR